MIFAVPHAHPFGPAGRSCGARYTFLGDGMIIGGITTRVVYVFGRSSGGIIV